jgi:hypothetical protein
VGNPGDSGKPGRGTQIQAPDTGRLYYRWYTETEKGGKWVCVVVKFLENDAFISTAYLARRIMPGELIWAKES